MCLSIVLSSLVRLGLPGYLFRVGFVVKMLIHFLCVPWIPLALMIRIMFYEAKRNCYVVFPIRVLFPPSDHMLLSYCVLRHLQSRFSV